jgi:hypothetical protein
MMFTKVRMLLFCGATLALMGCASSSKEIAAQYVSPLQYDGFSCEALRMEMARVQTRVSQLGGQLDKKASNDSTKMGVGLIIFWPALFFLDGDGPEANEYARLKGEYDALTQTATRKTCFNSTTEAKPDEASNSQTAPAPAMPDKAVAEPIKGGPSKDANGNKK